MRFGFPKDSEMYLWFDNRITLINEGLTTAQVEISDGDLELSEIVSLTEMLVQNDLQRIGSYPGSDRFALPPGQTMYVDWRTGRTLQDWRLAHEEADPPNPLGTCMTAINVMDEDHDGILDCINILIAGRPIEPVPGQIGQWQLATDTGRSIAAVVSRSRRYRVDGVVSTLTPPESDTQYQAWEALAQEGERTRP